MGAQKFQPLPNNVIYTIYAKCNNKGYTDLITRPFINEDRNDNPVNCTITIVTPKTVFTSEASMRLIGYGSRLYKKLSWGIKFFDKKFLGRKSMKIRAIANDPTLVREKLTTQLFRSVGVPVQEGTYARVFINGDTYGLYLLSDSINKRWMASYIHGNATAHIGTSYKLFSSPPEGPYSDFKYLGEDYTLYSENQTYVIDEFEKSDYPPTGDEDEEDDSSEKFKLLIEFTKLYDNWVTNYSNDPSDRSVQELAKFFNIESALRLLVIETLTLAVDNFFLTMSNAALYYNPERKNYQLLPFDFDETLLSYEEDLMDFDTYVQDCITWVNFKDNEIFDHYFTNNLLKHPKILERYKVILAKTSQELFDGLIISNYIHALADLIRDDVQWNIDAIDKLKIPYKGDVNHFTFKEFESNLDYGHVDFREGFVTNDAPWGVKEWVEVRSASCKAATEGVDTSKNENISDNYEVKTFKPGADISKGFVTEATLFFIICQIILYHVIF